VTYTVTQVLFGTTPATSFTVVNPTTISAVAPAHVAGTVDARVVTTNGTSPVTAVDQFTYTSGTTRTVTASGDITTALATAIDASADGDTVQITAGSCTCSNMNCHDTNITIQGAGIGQTIITTSGKLFTMFAHGANNPTFRISSMTLTGTGTSDVVIQIWANEAQNMRGPFRIDHVEFNYPNNGADGMLQVWGPAYGLIDHCVFKMKFEAAILTSIETDTENCSFNVGGTCTINTLQGNAGLALAYEPGGDKNLYVEDCTFTYAATTPAGFFAALDTAYGGGRIVFRHNTCTNVILYAHWTGSGSVNTLWWEIYSNSFTWNQANIDLYPMRLQGGGTGLIYNNTITGFTSANYVLIGDGRLPDQNQSGTPLLLVDGTHNWDGNAGDTAAPGWPALAQTGRASGKTMAQIQAGNKQASFPLYLWGNSAGFGVGHATAQAVNYFKSTPHTVTGGGFGQGDVDYSITTTQPSGAGTHTLTYTPYTYPHPLNT
jgi:hypothetical protein